ncbi:unnamed protein product, partial [Cladocopium goreaui]
STEGARLRLRLLEDIFSCPDGCEIPLVYKNDNFCDCSDCADEETWTCGTCGAFNEDEDQQEAQDVGADDGHGDGSHGRSHVFFAMKDPDFTMDFLRNDSIYMD